MSETTAAQKNIPRSGAVTFLEVLDWKGVRQRHSDAIGSLRALIERTRIKARKVASSYGTAGVLPEVSGSILTVHVLGISDTIALFTAGPPDVAIAIHAEVCAWILAHALSQHLALRGALSYGECSFSDNILLGYAVDEAASWHKSAGWLGVVLTPSACIHLRGLSDDDPYHLSLPASLAAYNAIPWKRQLPSNLDICVRWQPESARELRDMILMNGSQTPEVAAQYLNTIKFFEHFDLLPGTQA